MVADMWHSVDDEELDALAAKLGSPRKSAEAKGKNEPRQRESSIIAMWISGQRSCS